MANSIALRDKFLAMLDQTYVQEGITRVLEKVPERLHSLYSIRITDGSYLEVAPSESYISVVIYPTRSGTTSEGWDLVKSWLDFNQELQ